MSMKCRHCGEMMVEHANIPENLKSAYSCPDCGGIEIKFKKEYTRNRDIPISRKTLKKWLEEIINAQNAIISEWNHGQSYLAYMIATIEAMLNDEED